MPQEQGQGGNQPMRSAQPVRTRRKTRRRVDLKDYVQDFIPIKKIRDGIVETTDGRFLKILEIEPINFLLRSAAERMEIIYESSKRNCF